MLNEDVLRLIFLQSSLEEVFALSATNRLAHFVFKSLDGSFYKQRVLERVPWMTPSTKGSWKQCAIQLVGKSRRALRGEHKNELLIKDLHVAMSRCHNEPYLIKSWDLAREPDSVRHTMKALFEDRIESIMHQFKHHGTCLNGLHMELDLRDLCLVHSDFDMLEEEIAGEERDELRRNLAVSAKGTKVKHTTPNSWVQIIDENESLIQVRLQGEGGKDVDEIVHKASCKKTEDGTYLISSDSKGPRVYSKQFHTVGLFNLLPGQGGALVLKYCRKNPSASYIAYIEPTAELTTVILCTIPSPIDPKMHQDTAFEKGELKFHVTYDGYLYIFMHGRFLRLWVDLGYRIQLDECLGDNLEWKLDGRTKSRALVAWNEKFPALGTLTHQQFDNLNWDFVRGPKKGGLDRYITLDGVGGSVVCDLRSGKTYISLDTLGYKHLRTLVAIPFYSGEKFPEIGFYTIDPNVYDQLRGALELSHETRIAHKGRKPLDMTSAWDEWVRQQQPSWEVEKKMGINRHDVYEDIKGDGLYLHTKGRDPKNEVYLSFRKEELGPKNLNSRTQFQSVDNQKPLRRIVNSQTHQCTLWACKGH
ncbi:hypothetical protein CJU90_3219 [Yarrowia sp. C11]|nr:hypothetical protein CKK34_4666 [Yarrowia sp. E02]KAG5369712.1 hypothetical protein CJU90_3219 [Yarrowia sp. C11]